MTIDLISVGKTDDQAVISLMEKYMKRLNRYVKFSVVVVPDVRNTRNMPQEDQKRKEGEAILKNISPSDHVVLLDERGTEPRSVELARWLEKRMAGGLKRLVFVIGGPYGFSREIYERSQETLSLSKMTFSHQIVRPLFLEQLYRSFTIINNEPYHHE